jgi:hypothetical protein
MKSVLSLESFVPKTAVVSDRSKSVDLLHGIHPGLPQSKQSPLHPRTLRRGEKVSISCEPRHCVCPHLFRLRPALRQLDVLPLNEG